MQKLSTNSSSPQFMSVSLDSSASPPVDPFGDDGSHGNLSSVPLTPMSPKLTIAISGEPLDPNRHSDGLAILHRKNSEMSEPLSAGKEGGRDDMVESRPHFSPRSPQHHNSNRHATSVFFDRQLSQPVFFSSNAGDWRAKTVKAASGKPHAFNEDKCGEEYYVYDSTSGTIERRNHSQFAKVIERAAVSHTDLTLAAAARECAEFRRNACEAALEEVSKG